MDWMQKMDGYCERLGPGFWAEPFNAVTNLAFLLAALWMARRARGVPMAQALCGVLGAIAVGSFLFHTLATAWASLADTLPIAAFILIYLYAVNRDMLALRPGWAALATAAYLPGAALVTAGLAQVPFLRVSGAYWTVPLMLVLYAAALRGRLPAVARGFVIGAALLSVSIVLRSLDAALCPVWPRGTHFLWHLLNAVMLGWMIEVYLRHRHAARLAGGRAGR